MIYVRSARTVFLGDIAFFGVTPLASSGYVLDWIKVCDSVLQDPEVRQAIKQYSDWPTIPQLYVKGEFVGGSDIMMEMFENGELQQLVGAEA